MWGVAPTEEVTKPTLWPIEKGTPEPIHQGAVAIEMRVGDTHTVSLESNPTAGYRWALGSEYDERFLELVEQSFEPDSDLTGAPGRELFTFRALAFGIVVFSFNYKRPWEDRVLKTGRCTFVIGASEALADEMSEAEAREIAANSGAVAGAEIFPRFLRGASPWDSTETVSAPCSDERNKAC